MAAALHPQKKNACRPHTYHKFFQPEGLHNLPYPIGPEQMPEMEQLLNLKINLFSFFDDLGDGRYPLYISKRENAKQEIDLLYSK